MDRKPQTRDCAIERLQALAGWLGQAPSHRESDADDDSPCYVTYARRFGSWNAALEALGYCRTAHRRHTTARCLLLETLQQLADQLGRAPVMRELVDHGLPCQATYTARFGSWEAALAEIGLKPRGSRLYERDELLSVLRELAEELGHPPYQSDLWERERLPRPTTYKYRFGSRNQAPEAAGLIAPPQGPLESEAFEHIENDRGGVGEPQLTAAKIESHAATWEGYWITGHLAAMVPVFDTVECVVWVLPTNQEAQEYTKALFSSSQQ